MARTRAQTTDTFGRPWARLSATKAGNWLKADAGFTCINAEAEMEVQQDEKGLFVACAEGKHFISGQADDGEHMVGFYPVEIGK